VTVYSITVLCPGGIEMSAGDAVTFRFWAGWSCCPPGPHAEIELEAGIE
jgi:hypothetical protein